MENLDEIAKFDICNYKRQLFGMFSGREVEVTFKAREKLIDAVYDLFGVNTKLIPLSDDYFQFSASIQISDLFFGWCFCRLNTNNNLYFYRFYYINNFKYWIYSCWKFICFSF